jgi:hypothetical protein
MSKGNGDRSKWNRERRKKIARRADMRALRAQGASKPAPTPARNADQ